MVLHRALRPRLCSLPEGGRAHVLCIPAVDVFRTQFVLTLATLLEGAPSTSRSESDSISVDIRPDADSDRDQVSVGIRPGRHQVSVGMTSAARSQPGLSARSFSAPQCSLIMFSISNPKLDRVEMRLHSESI